MMMILLIAVVLLSYSNGANDNFKGVATLWGSGTLNYRPALVLATVATFAGSICSYFFASALIKNFSGKGLVPDEVILSLDFAIAVALAAGTTVLLATKFGFPISTTHGIAGSLVGAGLVAAGTSVNFNVLGTSFLLPLLLSPFIAILLSGLVYLFFKKGRQAAGITEETCINIGSKWVPVAKMDKLNFSVLPAMQTNLVSAENCEVRYNGSLIGFRFQPLINYLHIASAATVSFARGLNDTPKLISLLLLVKFFYLPINVFIIAIAIALGGILHARKVATTMSKKITTLNHGQGFTANFITGVLVIAASSFGLPVSTTHVSVGSIYGIGLVNKSADNKEVSKIGLSWLLTLPIAAILSGFIYFIIYNLTN